MSETGSNKEILIQEAKEGEAQTVERHFSTYEYFKQELSVINKIDNIFDNPKVKIKKDGLRYIFNINGQNKFTIAEANIESRIRKFCKETETRKEQEDLLIRITGLKMEYIKATTQEELDMLKDDIDRLKGVEQKESSIETVKKILARNILTLEQEKEFAKDTDKADKTDRMLRKAQRSQIQDRLDRLYRMKETIERLENNDAKHYKIKRETVDGKQQLQEVYMSDINAYNKKETVQQISQRLEEIANEQHKFEANRLAITNREAGVVPYYEIIINDKKDIKSLRKTLTKINNQYIILDNISLEAGKKTELARDLERLEEYLNKIETNPDTFKPSEHPFVPTHLTDFFELVKVDGALESLMILNTEHTKIGSTNTENTNTGASAPETSTEGKKTETENTTEHEGNGDTETVPSDYDSGKEAFAKGGVRGILDYRMDKTNMTESQKQTWSGVGNIALTGGIIFVGWKMISSAFKLLTKKGRSEGNLGENLGWLLGPTALIFGAQARSGEGPMSLLTGGKLPEKISNLFGRGSGNPDVTKNGITQTEAYTQGFVGLMGAFDMMTYGSMATVLEETNNGKLKIREDQYDEFITTLEAGNDKQKAGAKFLKTHVGKEDKHGVMDLTLRSMGITSMTDLTNDPTKDFKETAAGAATRVYSVYAFMEKERYNRINPETMPLIEAYIADTDATVDDLEDLKKRGDVFDITEAVTDKTNLAEKIKLIAPTDTTKQRYLLNGINDFYEYRPTTDKSGLDIIGTGPVVEFKTYGYTTKIDLDSKKIDGFSATDKFGSYAELFKAANLTNRLKYLCKDRTSTKPNPFYIQSSDLTFNDSKVFSLDFDTEMIKETTLKNISPTLSKFNQQYCDYLNAITPKIYKEAPTT